MNWMRVGFEWVPRERGFSAEGGYETGLGKATVFHIIKDMIKMGEMQVF
jgi:hypothetical protein